VLGAGQPIDFKLADAAANPSPVVTLETGMDRLSVRACKVRLCACSIQALEGASVAGSLRGRRLGFGLKGPERTSQTVTAFPMGFAQ
jgi:hypothetical protein